MRQELAVAMVSMLGASVPVRAEEPTPKPDAPDAAALLRQANELWHLKKDYNGALAAFNQAVDAAPDDDIGRLQRAGFCEVLSEIVTKDQVDRFKALANEDYRRIATNAPDSMRAGVARDGLTRLNGHLSVHTLRVQSGGLEDGNVVQSGSISAA